MRFWRSFVQAARVNRSYISTFLAKFGGRAHGIPAVTTAYARGVSGKRHLYRGPNGISVAAGRPTLGVEEDIFKFFVSGGYLCLVGNLRPETHFADRPRCGKSRAPNPGDVPHVPSATESAYRRMIRCVRMRARGSPRKRRSWSGCAHLPSGRRAHGLVTERGGRDRFPGDRIRADHP